MSLVGHTRGRFTATRLEVIEQLTRGRSTGGMVLLVSDLDASISRLRTQSAAVAAILIGGLAMP